MCDDSNNSLSDALPFSTLENPKIAAQKSACSEANQVDYKKFFQIGKTDTHQD